MLAKKYNEAKTEIEKKKVADDARIILEKSGTLKEFEVNYVDRVTKIDPSKEEYDKTTKNLKWIETSRGTDELINKIEN